MCLLCRLDIKTMFKIREWERYKFMIDYEHSQASETLVSLIEEHVIENPCQFERLTFFGCSTKRS